MTERREIGARHLLLLFALAAAVTFVRSPAAFLWPILHAEDGVQMFAFYIANPDPAALFREYAGYVSLLPNFAGWASARLPVTWAPHAMTLYALALGALAHSVFAWRRFRCVVTDDRQRLAACLLLILVPVGNHVLAASATYSAWHLLWLLLLLAAAPLDRGWLPRLILFAGLVLAAWSHPLSVCVLPVCAWRMLRPAQSGDRWFHGALILAVATYAWRGVAPAAVPDADWWGGAGRTFAFVLDRIFFEAAAGNRLRVWLHANDFGWAAVGGGLAIATAAALVLVRAADTRAERATLAVASVYALGLTWLCVVARGLGTGDAGFAWEQRYFYLQQMTFLLVAGSIGVRLWQRLPPPRRRVPSFAVVVWLAFLNASNLHYFSTSRQEGQAVRSFLEQVQAARPGDPELVLERGDWTIRVRPPR